ncbi:MAG: hypothetical protein R2873_01595 [Caldilineaceae bacterium]|nr:hypothetical protein [Caldilineaceae bacterium]
MFANFVHASSEYYLHTLKEEAEHRQRSFAECCQIWPFRRKTRRQNGAGDAHRDDISYQPPRHALNAR